MNKRAYGLMCLLGWVVSGPLGCTVDRNSQAAPAGVAQWSLQPTTLVADGRSAASYTLTPYRPNGEIWTGAEVAVDARGAQAVVEQPPPPNALGTTSATVRCIQAGVLTLSARVYEGQLWYPLAGTAQVTCTAPQEVPTLTLTAPHDIATADLGRPLPLTLLVTDAQGRPLAGQWVTLAAARASDQVAPSVALTDAHGQVQMTLTAASLGAATVVAQTGAATASLTVQIVPGAPSQAHSFVQASPSSVIADGASTSTVTAVVQDALGNPAPGFTVIFAAGGGNNTLSPLSVTTDSSGLASTTLSSTRAELKTLTASTGGITLTGNVVFVPGAPSLAMSNLAITPLTRVADGSQTITASAQINDAYANPVPNLATSVTVTGASTTVTPSAGTTNAAGYFASAISTPVVQIQNITLTAGPLAATASVNFTPGPPSAATSSFVAAPNTGLASNGSAASTMTVTLRDSFSRVVPGQTVRFSAAGSRGTLMGLSSVTDGLGMAQTALTSMYAGNVVVVANTDGIALNANAQFIPKTPFCSTNLTLGQRPLLFWLPDSSYEIQAADLNQDGNMDLIFPTGTAAGVNIYYGQGYGTFNAGITYAKPDSTNTVAIADFDHDGYLDIIHSVQSDYVSVLLGQPGFSMADHGTVSIGTSVAGAGVCAADLNQDGHMDVVSVYNSPSGLAILLGDGAGGFTLSATYPVSSSVHRCAIADFDGDGYPDIAVTNYGNNSLDVYYGSSGGAFSAANSFAVGDWALYLQVGLLNQDSLPDIVVTNHLINGTLSVLLGAPGRSFQPAVSYFVGDSPRNAEIIDINGDGEKDLIINNYAGGAMYLLGQGDGTFAPASYASAPGKTAAITVADFDSDGALDIAYVLSSVAMGGISFATSPNVLPTLSGTIGGSLGATANQYPAIADFNKDGNMDIIAVGQGTAAVLLLGEGTGKFLPPSQISGTNTAGGAYVVTGDINGDGNMDAVIMNVSSPAISILINTGDGNFTINTIDVPTNSWSSVTTGDVNDDGLDDILATPHASNVYQFITTSPSGNTFSSSIINTTSNTCEVARVVDINNDGLKDVLVGCDSLVTMIGNGTGTYSSINLTSTGTSQGAYRVDTADFNGDGYVDAITSDAGVVYLFQNQKDGTFAKTVTLDTSAACWYGTAADINGDGLADVVLATTAELNVWLGTGTGSFGPRQVYPGPRFFGIAVGDLNHDGKPDIVAASGNDGLITYLSSGCTPN